MITYHRIAKILYTAKVDTVEKANKLPQIVELKNENQKAVTLAIDYYFNNDNYDPYFDIKQEVEKLNH